MLPEIKVQLFSVYSKFRQETFGCTHELPNMDESVQCNTQLKVETLFYIRERLVMKKETYNAWITWKFCMQVACNRLGACAEFQQACLIFTMKGLARKKVVNDVTSHLDCHFLIP